MTSKHAPKTKRICIICNKEFYPTNGRATTCGDDCSYQRKQIYNKKYQINNLDKVAQWSRESQQRNKDKINQRAKLRYQKDKATIKIRNESNELLRSVGIKKQGECVDCHEIKKLQIHHITYTKDDFILICEKCHLKRHKKTLYAH